MSLITFAITYGLLCCIFWVVSVFVKKNRHYYFVEYVDVIDKKFLHHPYNNIDRGILTTLNVAVFPLLFTILMDIILFRIATLHQTPLFKIIMWAIFITITLILIRLLILIAYNDEFFDPLTVYEGLFKHEKGIQLAKNYEISRVEIYKHVNIRKLIRSHTTEEQYQKIIDNIIYILPFFQLAMIDHYGIDDLLFETPMVFDSSIEWCKYYSVKHGEPCENNTNLFMQPSLLYEVYHDTDEVLYPKVEQPVKMSTNIETGRVETCKMITGLNHRERVAVLSVIRYFKDMLASDIPLEIGRNLAYMSLWDFFKSEQNSTTTETLQKLLELYAENADVNQFDNSKYTAYGFTFRLYAFMLFRSEHQGQSNLFWRDVDCLGNVEKVVALGDIEDNYSVEDHVESIQSKLNEKSKSADIGK